MGYVSEVVPEFQITSQSHAAFEQMFMSAAQPTICSSLVSVVFKWVKHILLKCVSMFKSKGQQRRAPEEGQSEGAPEKNDTLRSSVSGHLWSDTTLCPRNPFILEPGGLLNEITFVMRKVTSCAAHCAHFKCSLQNMASGESFERGQLFTIKIWPLKTPNRFLPQLFCCFKCTSS